MLYIDIFILFCIGSTNPKWYDQQSSKEVVDRSGRQRIHNNVNKRNYIFNTIGLKWGSGVAPMTRVLPWMDTGFFKRIDTDGKEGESRLLWDISGHTWNFAWGREMNLQLRASGSGLADTARWLSARPFPKKLEETLHLQPLVLTENFSQPCTCGRNNTAAYKQSKMFLECTDNSLTQATI